MKLKAESVLEDCERALKNLIKAEEESDKENISIHMFTCVVLLRTVGFVLYSVDAEKQSNHKDLFASIHNKYKEEIIFKKFIEGERNSLVHEYISLIQEKEIEKDGGVMLFEDGSAMLSEDGSVMQYESAIKKVYLKSGIFKEGDSLSLIIQEGIYWWKKYIAELKNKLS